jgi:hypothetical protein
MPTIPAGGGRVAVPVVTNRECAWTATSNSSWIQLSPTSGQGEASITLTATANPQGLLRNGNIAVNGSQFAVTQAASPCTFSFNPADVTIAATGGRAGTRVDTLVGCAWTANSPASWALVQTNSGTGPGPVEVAVAENLSLVARKVDVAIGGRNFTITQSAATPTPLPPAPTPGPNPAPAPTPPPSPLQCSYGLDPLTQAVGSKGADRTVQVQTESGCPWTATSDVSWVAIKGAAAGTGTANVKYEVDRNKSTLPRIGSITIAGLTHLIMQDGGED